jgi:hypothetical protein
VTGDRTTWDGFLTVPNFRLRSTVTPSPVGLSPCHPAPCHPEKMDTDHVRQEFLTSARRVVVAFLGLMLLVAFWADRPAAAASYPKAPPGPVFPGEPAAQPPAAEPPAEPAGTAIISIFRKPWLTFYRVMGAPALDRGQLTEEEETRFRLVVGCLAFVFLTTATYCWIRGQRLIDEGRNTNP